MQQFVQEAFMANSDTLLIWLIVFQFAFFLLPGIAWLIDRGIHALRKPPVAWSGRRLHTRFSRFESYRRRAILST